MNELAMCKTSLQSKKPLTSYDGGRQWAANKTAMAFVLMLVFMNAFDLLDSEQIKFN